MTDASAEGVTCPDCGLRRARTFEGHISTLPSRRTGICAARFGIEELACKQRAITRLRAQLATETARVEELEAVVLAREATIDRINAESARQLRALLLCDHCGQDFLK